MDDITHEMRLSQWTALLRECSNSGLSKKEWMRANHIKEKQFYYWQRRVRNEVFQELSSTSVPSHASFVELASYASADFQDYQAAATLRFADCTIEIHNSISSDLLKRILQVITHV